MNVLGSAVTALNAACRIARELPPAQARNSKLALPFDVNCDVVPCGWEVASRFKPTLSSRQPCNRPFSFAQALLRGSCSELLAQPGIAVF